MALHGAVSGAWHRAVAASCCRVVLAGCFYCARDASGPSDKHDSAKTTAVMLHGREDQPQPPFAESKVGMYLNSTKDSAGTVVKTPNCSRLWDPDWKIFGSGRGSCSVPDDARMGLMLIKDVK